MKRILVTISALTILAISGVSALALMPGQQGDNNTSAQVVAEEKTANFNVENMTCAKPSMKTCFLSIQIFH